MFFIVLIFSSSLYDWLIVQFFYKIFDMEI